MQGGVPILMCCDNQTAINVVRNNAKRAATRHMKTRFHFVRELHDDVILHVCREGGENESNIMIMNPISAEFEKHSPKMHGEAPEELLEKVKKEEGCQKVLGLRHLIWRLFQGKDHGGC